MIICGVVCSADSREANKNPPEGMKGVTRPGDACDVEIGRERLFPAVPVGKDLAVVVDLDLKHLVLVQPAGNGPPESLEESRRE